MCAAEEDKEIFTGETSVAKSKSRTEKKHNGKRGKRERQADEKNGFKWQ